MRDPNTITLDRCVHRGLYRLHARNMKIGVYCATRRGFYGLRTKFGDVYVDFEYHWDASLRHGTACPTAELSERLPENIPVASDLGTECTTCHRHIRFDSETKGWEHIGEGECATVAAVSIYNAPLEEWLHQVEAEFV